MLNSKLNNLINLIVVSISFNKLEKIGFESDGGANVTVVLKGPVATTSQVTVVDGEGIYQLY